MGQFLLAAVILMVTGLLPLASARSGELPEARSGPLSEIRTASVFDDFIGREAMIPMRDGVKLYTLILIPKARSGPLPIMLERTPYGAADSYLYRPQAGRLETILQYKSDLPPSIIVIQDVRGQFRSEGRTEFLPALRGPFNAGPTDDTTDAYDSIDWLVRNVPESNGKVGMFGTSYDGWAVLAALLDPHPALAVAVPVNPMVDIWRDDFFHNGAFRLSFSLEFFHAMETRPDAWVPAVFGNEDQYDWWRQFTNARDAQAKVLPHSPFFAAMLDEPAYTPRWQDRSIEERLKTSRARLVPTMHVHGLFDQEDIYGAPLAYRAMEQRDPQNDRNFFVAGPWYHGQAWEDGDRIGKLRWHDSTGRSWRRQYLRPFLEQHLTGGPRAGLPPVLVFDTGRHEWTKLDRWAAKSAAKVALHLSADGTLGLGQPAAEGQLRFVSDPAKPVPYLPRPVGRNSDPLTSGVWDSAEWQGALVTDQRFVDGRPDVLTYVSPVLDKPVTVRGDVVAHLFASTTGTDADWVVKLIDQFPGEHSEDIGLSGYQLMVSGEIFRGRYRESFAEAKPIAPDTPLPYRIELPQMSHTFLPGHRIMVQIQSSWFPLYERNPQTFVTSIPDAPREAFRAATHTIHSGGITPSRIELPVVPVPGR